MIKGVLTHTFCRRRRKCFGFKPTGEKHLSQPQEGEWRMQTEGDNERLRRRVLLLLLGRFLARLASSRRHTSCLFYAPLQDAIREIDVRLPVTAEDVPSPRSDLVNEFVRLSVWNMFTVEQQQLPTSRRGMNMCVFTNFQGISFPKMSIYLTAQSAALV